MDLSKGISSLIFLAFCSCALSSQLYLQPQVPETRLTGDSFFVTCFSSEDGMDQLRWLNPENNPISHKDNKDAVSGHSIHTEATEGNLRGLRLVFTNVEADDAGQYTCSDDQDSTSFDLSVNRAITFGDTPTVQHVREGENGIILCNAKAEPKPVVTWYFKDSMISNGPRYQINGTNHSLKIHNVTRHDAGKYKCKAYVITSMASQNKELNIVYHVQYAPEIIGVNKTASYAVVGQTKNLTCAANADPVPRFEWLYEEMILHNGTNNIYVFNTDNSSTLQLPVEDEEAFGEYICSASNPLGSKTVQIELKEGVTPGASKISVVGEDQGVVKLRLDTVEDKTMVDELKVTGYRVEYVVAKETWDAALSQEFTIGDAYELRNLSYNTDYVLRASAFNAAGAGPFSEDFPYKTHPLQTAPVVAAASHALASAIVLVLSLILLL